MKQGCMVVAMLDVNRIRVFRAVVASGSVQDAAANLGYTPSAISQNIGTLQRETGLRLFEKSGRGITPTPAGRALAAGSDEVMGSLARLDGVVNDLREGRSGTLGIASFASAGEQWTPPVARVLQQEFPDVQFTIDVNEYTPPGGPAPDIDIRTEEPAQPPSRIAGYTRHELTQEPYVVVLAADHPLAGEDVVPLSALATERWVADNPSDDVCSQIVSSATRAAGFTPRYAARTMNHHTSIALAAAGVGVAVVPRLAVGVLPADAVQRPLTDPTPRRRIVVFVRDNVSANPAVARTLQLLKEIATDA